MPTKQPMMIAIETKEFPFELKSFDEDLGIIRGYLSVFNNVDGGKDRVRPGAFKKTIADGLQRKANKGKKFLWPLLWFHEPSQPIGGFIDAEEDAKGLFVTAQLDISTNAQGFPLNPQATSVFSGFKMGYIDELSIGYQAIQKSYDNQGIRDLTEIRLVEGSAITMLFAMNDEAQVTTVKAVYMQTKADLLPLAPKGTLWSKSKAMKDIQSATNGDWSKAGKYFLWNAPNPSKEADFKFPIAANVGGSMKAVPHAIYNAAARLSSAQGVDTDAIKSKLNAYYDKLGETPPWKNGGKAFMPTTEKKDFNDRYREEQIRDWKTTDYQNLTIALQAAIMDIFMIGDEPQEDVLNTILNGVDNGSDDPGNKIGFIDAVRAYVQKGIDLDVANYIADDNQYFGNVSSYGYMSRNDTLDTKAGAVVSQSNADRMQGHVDTLNALAQQHKDMQKKLGTVADDITRYITGNPAYVDSDGKSLPFRPSRTPEGTQPLTSTEEELAIKLAAFFAN